VWGDLLVRARRLATRYERYRSAAKPLPAVPNFVDR
jgi:hypothetical protein